MREEVGTALDSGVVAQVLEGWSSQFAAWRKSDDVVVRVDGAPQVEYGCASKLVFGVSLGFFCVSRRVGAARQAAQGSHQRARRCKSLLSQLSERVHHNFGVRGLAHLGTR